MPLRIDHQRVQAGNPVRIIDELEQENIAESGFADDRVVSRQPARKPDRPGYAGCAVMNMKSCELNAACGKAIIYIEADYACQHGPILGPDGPDRDLRRRTGLETGNWRRFVGRQ